MRSRGWLILSLGLNAALGSVFLYYLFFKPSALDRSSSGAPTVVTNAGKTHVVIRRQFFDWSQIESPDYPTYVANLRSINCPTQTIRDIIVADVNQLYADKRASEGLLAFDKLPPDADPAVLQAKLERLRALDAERRALLTSLLGDGWETYVAPVIAGIPTLLTNTAAIDFSQGTLAQLTPEQQQMVQTICNRASRLQATYVKQQQDNDLPIDPAELARLRQQTRTELTQVLNPAQYEDFLLRYSSTSERLRSQFSKFEVSADEFRQLFQVCDPFDQQMDLYYSATDPATLRKRQELEQQREAVIKKTLGSRRYAAYQFMMDPAFQEAQSAVQKGGGVAEAVVPVYAVKQVAIDEQQRIKNDPTLTLEQREQALRNLRIEQQVFEEDILDISKPPLPPP